MTRSIPTLCRLCLLFAFQASVLAQTITNQPQSITVNNASTAEFSIGATNATSFQWKFNGANLSDGANISGSTNSTLTLEDVNSNQIGNYSVLINGTLTSSNAALTVIPGTVVQFAISGFLGGGTSNVDVQLFDHDKPATVENFIHYITSGAFTNMFFERVVPGFVLQGGSHGASNQTATTSPVTGWTIPNIQPTPPFPQQVNSEFGVGPLIHNRFGTVAMALASGDPNSATSGFFFNLIDNSTNLDSQDFTVFGRILNGTNTLQYFNTLPAGAIISNAVFLNNGALSTNPFPMPVNYIANSPPANDNLVFCGFTFSNGAPPADTNLPTVSIMSPAPGTLETNANPVVQGTASDDVGVANVSCVLTPQAAADGTLPNGGKSITNYATGTTNWSATLNTGSSFFGYSPVPQGSYTLSVQSQDGEGNLSSVVSQPLTNTAVFIIGNGTVSFTGGASSSNNPVGYPFQIGTNYQLQATPAANQTFVTWNGNNYYSTYPQIGFGYQGQLVLTATFISNDVGGIAFTFPTNNATLPNTLFNITGTINTNILTPPVTVTCQIFTNSVSNHAVIFPISTAGTNTWSVAETNYIATGQYFVQALATDQAGNQTVISNTFNYIADTNAPTIAITSPSNNALLFNTNTLAIQGTAASDGIVPLGSVNITMSPQAAADGVTAQGSVNSFSAVGTTNWSVSLSSAFSGYIPPGTFQVVAQAVTAPGAVSSQTNMLTISGILTNGSGTVTLTQGTNAKANPIGYPLQYGVSYKVKATPSPGSAFVNWTYGNSIVDFAEWDNFTYYGGLLTANFILTNAPRGTKGITFTYPPANSRIMTNNFVMKGTIAHSVKSAQVTVQIFSLTTGAQAGSTLTTSGTTTWSVPVTNLAPDIYGVTAVATNSSGISTVISEAFEVLQFNRVAGTYNGLFLCTTAPVAPTNSGFFTFTVSSLGAYSGKVLIPAYKPIPVQDALDVHGQGQHDLKISGDTIHMLVSLNQTNGADELTGTVTSLSNGWSSQLICYRGATKLPAHGAPAAGKYGLALEPVYWAGTNGYASLAVSGGGAVTLGGALPDGATFSESAKIATNGIWPLYAVPTGYKTSGLLMGWVTNGASNSVGGELYWYKAPNIGTYFTGGVDTNVNLTGTNFVGPTAGNYSIVFQGGSISTPITNQLTVARAGGQFKPAATSDQLAISLSSAGVLTGHFTVTGITKPLQFKGIFLGPSQGGSGFVLDSGNRTGYFVLEFEP